MNHHDESPMARVSCLPEGEAAPTAPAARDLRGDGRKASERRKSYG
jgi:hypothetical protein